MAKVAPTMTDNTVKRESRKSGRTADEVAEASIEVILAELRRTLRWGHPIQIGNAGRTLPELAVCHARASDQTIYARIDALNNLLIDAVENLDTAQPDDGSALRKLWGIDQNSRVTLTRRRIEANNGRWSQDHFRKQIEPHLLRDLAAELHRQNSLYLRPSRKVEASGMTPTIRESDFTEQEERISRIWAAVYGLRAEIIAANRHETIDNHELDVSKHTDAALMEYGNLLNQIHSYLDRYGERLIRHGEADFDPEALIRLAGWRLPLSERETEVIRLEAAKRFGYQ